MWATLDLVVYVQPFKAVSEAEDDPCASLLDHARPQTTITGTEAQEFVRLFMVPGTQHCGGGPGPDVFDALAPLEAWVEDGAAPDQMIGTNADTGMTRPLCPYTQVAAYSGTGSTDEAENFSCGNPE